jgi:hypothetical protein
MEQDFRHIDEHTIRTKAHELWILRGCPKGSPEEDWDQAERLLRAEAARRSGVAQEPTRDTSDPANEPAPARARARRRRA